MIDRNEGVALTSEGGADLDRSKQNYPLQMRSAWWINRQINDQFVRKAIQNDYRSRSAFKLLEIHEKYNLIRAGNAILDCGAAPGGWSEATMNVLQSYDTGNTKSSLLVAADIKRFDLIAGAICLHPLNLSSPIALERIQKILANNGRHYFDLILSDMAPTMTGQADADHSNSIVCTHLHIYRPK
jgi:23S rRNA (uridine2552-2'-O)-methyltransferase